jgi:hypothetical protein
MNHLVYKAKMQQQWNTNIVVKYYKMDNLFMLDVIIM